MSGRRLIAGLLVASSLGGCVVGPRYATPGEPASAKGGFISAAPGGGSTTTRPSIPWFSAP